MTVTIYTATWNTTTGDWFTSADWTDESPSTGVPGADNNVNLPDNNGGNPYTVTYDGTDTINNLNGATPVTLDITGGTLTVTDGGIEANAGSFGGTIDVDSGATLTNTTGTLIVYNGTIGGTLAGSGDIDFFVGDFTIDAGATLSMGTWELGVNGDGAGSTTTLDTSLTYTGTFLADEYNGNNSILDLNGHTLTLTGPASLYGTIEGSVDGATDGSGTLKVEDTATEQSQYSGGTTVLGGAILEDVAGATITQEGNVRLGNSEAPGTMQIDANANYDITGTWSMGGDDTANALLVNNGTIAVSGTNTTATLDASLSGTGNITIASGDELSAFFGDYTFSGAISGAGELFVGPATDTIDTTSITVATLDLGSNGEDGSTTTLDVNLSYGGNFLYNGAFNFNTLNLNGHTLTLGGTATISSGEISGPGTIKITGSATFSGGVYNASPTIEIAGGTAEFTSSNLVPAGITFADIAGGTLRIDDANTPSATIGGMTVGDYLDLSSISYSSGDYVVWQQNGAGGTLSLLNGSNATLDTLNLSGTFTSADFVAKSDNSSGTFIEDRGTGVANDDFTGAGTSDLLLADGNMLADWLVQNGAVTRGVSIGSTGTWSLVGTGDFTGNGVDDLLLSDGTSLVDWTMQNGGVSSGAYLTDGGLPAGWNVIGTGDFNGNGTSDILLQSGSTLVDWTVENGALQGGHTIGNLPAGWSVIGTGDFNGDGTTDLLLQDGSNLAAWYLQNGTYAGGALITSQLPTGWSVVGTGDFNGDGTTDLLLQDGTQLADWTIKNGAIQSGYNIGPLPAGWSVAGTGDYNGDGTSDLLLQNGTQMAIWTLHNGQAQHGYAEPSLPAGWTIVPSKGLVT
jgi:hypothetical protein